MTARKRLDKGAVRARIKAAGTSQLRIAQLLYYTPAAVGYWCRGLNRVAVSDIETMASILGCTVEDIILKEGRT